MAAIRSSSSSSSTTGTAISVSAPAGTVTGDLVFVFVHANTDTTIVDNNGSTAFTEDVNDYHPNPTHGHTVSLFSRRIVGGDPSTYNFTSGASGRWSIIAITVSSPNTNSIYDVSPATSNNSDGNDSSFNVPSITTATDNAIDIVMAGLDDGATSVSGSPSGYTVLQNTTNQPMGTAYKVIAVAGATGTRNFTFSGGTSSIIGVSFAIPAQTAPTVTTDTLNNAAYTTLDTTGNVSSDGGSAITERGFVLATTSNPTTANTKYTLSGTTGAMSTTLTSLTAGTTYHVRAYAINAIGTSYGTDLSLATLSLAVPTVTSDSLSNPTTTTLDATGNVTVSGGSTITQRGFVVSTSSNPTTADLKYVVAGTTGSMSTTLTGLSVATTYHMRAFATNSTGTGYGADLSNTTSSVVGAGPSTASGIIRKHYFYKIYDAGMYQTTWVQDVISEPAFHSSINGGSGELMIRLARDFDNFGEDNDVKLNNKVECYCVDREAPNGILIYSGFISGYKPIIKEANQYVEVTCFNYVAELQRTILRTSGGNTTIAYNSYDPANIAKDVIDKLRVLGVSLNYTASSILLTNTVVSYTFNTNTGKEALDKIIELCPTGWYWRIDSDNIVYLQPKNILADHTFSLGKEIENLETYRRIEDLVNTVYFTGAGNPALFYKYQNTGSQNTYGKYERKLVDQRVSDSATASIMANRLIDQQKDPEIRSRFTIVDSNGPSSVLGYNIESIKVGQTLKVGNLKTGLKSSTLWDVGQWDVDVWDQTLSSQAADVIQILSLDYKPDSIIIEASSRLPQIAKRIEDINRNLEVTQTVNNPTLAS